MCPFVHMMAKDFSALEAAGAVAKGEGWRRRSRSRLVSRLVSHLPSFPSVIFPRKNGQG